jgi:outer membrane protein OmpA-like peptidoglycan-associated protein
MGFGLMNVLRLSNRVDLTLDIRGNIYENGYNNPAGYISTALGLSFNLGKTNFVRASNWHNPKDVAALDAAAASAAALTAANAALEAEKKALQNANADLTSKNNDLQRALAEAQANMGLTEVGPAVFYFEIGKAVLSQKELEHLDFYLKNVLPNVKGKTLTVITGTADKKTGTTKRNNLLCEQRAEYIKNLMAEQYGIDVSDFETRTVLPTDGDASLNRAVIISFE